MCATLSVSVCVCVCVSSLSQRESQDCWVGKKGKGHSAQSAVKQHAGGPPEDARLVTTQQLTWPWPRGSENMT